MEETCFEGSDLIDLIDNCLRVPGYFEYCARIVIEMAFSFKANQPADHPNN